MERVTAAVIRSGLGVAILARSPFA